MRYPLPKDTAEALARSLQQNRNLGLALDKFRPINNELNEGQSWNHPDEDPWKITEEAKRRGRSTIPSFTVPIPTLLKSVNARREAMFAGLRERGHEVSDFKAATEYRLVVGFGSEHVLESSLCLHRIYGIPIIPGSAIKGVTRACAFWEIAGALEVPAVTIEAAKQRKDKETPLQWLDRLLSAGAAEEQQKMLRQLKGDELCREVEKIRDLTLEQWQALAEGFYKIFGTTERQGQVIFFDAYPAQPPEMEADVLNPHYSPYYSDKSNSTPPADYYNPIPSYFLTVAHNSRFHFAVASRDSGLATRAHNWLNTALQELGVGGKTAAGYGYFV